MMDRPGTLRRIIVAAACAAAIGTVQPVRAGWYGWDPSVPRERRSGNVYFGSAKDGDGRFLQGVTVVLVTPMVDFVTITGQDGRFRLELPEGLHSVDVTPRCSKNGYAVGQTIKRPPPGGALSPVQVDCVLRPDVAP